MGIYSAENDQESTGIPDVDQAESKKFNRAVNWARDLPDLLDGQGRFDRKLHQFAMVVATYADWDTGKNCRPGSGTLERIMRLSDKAVRDLWKRGVEQGLWVDTSRKHDGITVYDLQLNADLSAKDFLIDDKRAARRKADRERQARRREAQRVSQGNERDVTQGTAVTASRNSEADEVSRKFAADVTEVCPVTSRKFGADVTDQSSGDQSFNQPRVDQPAHTPSLAPAARSRKEGEPRRRMNGVDQEALRLALDTMAEYSDYDWRPAWTKYLSGIERQGFHIQPQYVVELQAIFAVILTEKDKPTLDACVERVLQAKAPYSTSAVATFAISRMFGKSLAPVSDEDIADWTTKQYATLLAWTPKTTAPEVEVPLQRGSHTVSSGEEKPLPVNALVAMRQRVLAMSPAPKPKTAEDLEIEQRIREEEESDARWAAMTPAEREAQQAANRRLAGDLARESKAAQERATQEAEERGMARLARRSADHARAWASMTVAS